MSRARVARTLGRFAPLVSGTTQKVDFGTHAAYAVGAAGVAGSGGSVILHVQFTAPPEDSQRVVMLYESATKRIEVYVSGGVLILAPYPSAIATRVRLEVGRTYALAMTWSAAAVRLYVNGVVAHEAAGDYRQSWTGSPQLLLGNYPASSMAPPSRIGGEAYLYNRALSAGEVANHCLNGEVPEAPVSAWGPRGWDDTDTIKLTGGAGNNGTATRATNTLVQEFGPGPAVRRDLGSMANVTPVTNIVSMGSHAAYCVGSRTNGAGAGSILGWYRATPFTESNNFGYLFDLGVGGAYTDSIAVRVVSTKADLGVFIRRAGAYFGGFSGASAYTIKPGQLACYVLAWDASGMDLFIDGVRVWSYTGVDIRPDLPAAPTLSLGNLSGGAAGLGNGSYPAAVGGEAYLYARRLTAGEVAAHYFNGEVPDAPSSAWGPRGWDGTTTVRLTSGAGNNGTVSGSGVLAQSSSRVAVRPSASNLLLHSADISNAAWTKQASNTVAQVAGELRPDGTTGDVSRVTLGGAVNQGVLQVATATWNGELVERSVWVRGAAGGTVTLTDPSTSVGVVTVTLTAAWQRVRLTEPAIGNSGLGCGLWIRKGTATSVDVWGAQIARVAHTSMNAPYTPTTTALVNAGVADVTEVTEPRAQNLVDPVLTSSSWAPSAGASVVAVGDGSYDVTDSTAAGYGDLHTGNFAIIPGRTVVVSCKVRKTTGSAPTMAINLASAANHQARFNTDLGVVYSPASCTATCESYDSEWWLLKIAAVPATSPVAIQVYPTVDAYGSGGSATAPTGTKRIKDFCLSEARAPATVPQAIYNIGPADITAPSMEARVERGGIRMADILYNGVVGAVIDLTGDFSVRTVVRLDVGTQASPSYNRLLTVGEYPNGFQSWIDTSPGYPSIGATWLTANVQSTVRNPLPRNRFVDLVITVEKTTRTVRFYVDGVLIDTLVLGGAGPLGDILARAPTIGALSTGIPLAATHKHVRFYKRLLRQGDVDALRRGEEPDAAYIAWDLTDGTARQTPATVRDRMGNRDGAITFHATWGPFWNVE